MALSQRTLMQCDIQTFSNSDNHYPNTSDLFDRSTTSGSDNFHIRNTFIKKCTRGMKRKRNECEDTDVIQVKAKRGQATDSHSLAERARRTKINERLKCLQTLIPGCYTTMGMAVMLDAAISYVQSLQNRIEFLSMKLSAASTYYDFNSPSTIHVDTIEWTNVIHNAQEMAEKTEREEFGGFVHY